MSDAGGTDRRWSEREVGLILQRAVELEKEDESRKPRALQRTDGASLAELEAVASEVGVEPALVRRAAAELDARPRLVDVSPWTGGPRRIVFERVLQGEAPLPAIEALLGVVQDALGEHGQPGMVGRTFTWSSLTSSARHGPRGRQISITVASRDGVTTIRVEEELGNVAGRVFGGLVGGVGWGSTPLVWGIGVGALHSPAAAVLISLLTLGSSYAGARRLYRGKVRTRTEELQGLVVRIAEHLQAALDVAALPAAPAR
jgi:hypothetical protein